MKLRNVAVSAALALGMSFVWAQDPSAQSASTGTVIRSETRVVLVDAVVTDKKGNYVHGLTEKDFKVFEDNKEQKITSFTFEADANSPLNSQKRYIVLFFDNSTMTFGEQALAREQAAKFIETNAGPNRLMAIVNYGGGLQVTQNFTEDAERLKAVVKGTKLSSVSPNPAAGVQLSGAMADFGARDMILALRSFAKNLSAVPGRKTLILLTSGFPLANEQISEVQATIDVCNRSNVAIYPIDARGLYVPPPGENRPPGLGPRGMIFAPTVDAWPVHVVLAMGQRGTPTPPASPGGGGTSRSPTPGAGTPSTGTTGPRGSPPSSTTGGTGRSGVTTTNPGNTGGGSVNLPRNPMNDPLNNRSRALIPKFPESSSTNQQLLYMLANGTGGFVIANTNDLLSGMEKIGKEQNEYYLLGYTPPESQEGSCHELKVRVDHSAGALTRARTGYCNAKPRDLLAGNPIEKQLETRAAASQPGNAQASVQAPFFYTASNVARVNVAMEISPETMKFDKDKGKLHGTVNVLGIAYRPDGSTAARFSDAVKLNFENKKEVEQFKETPLHYENQFDIAAGKYTLKVVFSAGGDSFGKVETPLNIDAYESSQFTVSGIALSRDLRKAADSGALDAAMLEDRTPLIIQGMQVVPAGSYRFKTEEHPVMYVEVYEPLLLAWKNEKPPTVAMQIRLVDRKTGQQKEDTGAFRIEYPMKVGNPVIPVGMKLSAGALTAGSYRVELTAFDEAGKTFKRSADFEVE